MKLRFDLIGIYAVTTVLITVLGIAMGVIYFCEMQFTGPCAWQGGSYASPYSDRIYCNNGVRLKQQ